MDRSRVITILLYVQQVKGYVENLTLCLYVLKTIGDEARNSKYHLICKNRAIVLAMIDTQGSGHFDCDRYS